MVVGVADGQLIKSCVILRTDEYMDGLLKEGSRLDSFCLDSHLWLQFLWCACCDVPWSRMFGIDGEEKRKCERNEANDSSMCVLCPVYTIYTYTHVHCICTAGGQGIFFPTGKSILPTRLLLQHLLSFAQHHQVGICAINHPFPEKEVLCCYNEPSQVSSVTSLFAFSLRLTHSVSITLMTMTTPKGKQPRENMELDTKHATQYNSTHFTAKTQLMEIHRTLHSDPHIIA